MPKPAVIVGLGGTGQWVLTWLKRNLILSNNRQMPDNVRLLEIDTAAKLKSEATSIEFEEKSPITGQEEVSIGGVTLDPGEFVYVGGEIRPLIENIRSRKYPQMGWFRAERWLNDLPPSAFTLNEGAGRLRQFGRLAVFKDILGQQTHSGIWRALRTSIEAVRMTTAEEQKLEIMVVGSFAGGTGSGMFVDVALILRMLAQQIGAHYVLRGFFALPDAFISAPDPEMKARSFAAWRELNRFMAVNENFSMPKIQYVVDNEIFQISPKQRLFDACYLVDGKRDNKLAVAEEKYDVFPVIAEAIGAVLDEKALTSYTQQILTNLGPEYSNLPGTPTGMWNEYRVEYEKYFKDAGHTLDPSLLHIFPAEALASKFERDDFRRTGVYSEIHPQVVMLLEDPSALDQFLYMYALGKVEYVETDGVYRWELKLQKGRESVWLTPGWNETKDKDTYPRPSLIDAIHGYVLHKQNQSPANHLPIDTLLSSRVIQEAFMDLRKSADDYTDIEYEIEWINQQLGSNGVVSAIRNQALDPDDGHQRKEYMDIARVEEMILLERQKDLKTKQSGRTKPKA